MRSWKGEGCLVSLFASVPEIWTRCHIKQWLDAFSKSVFIFVTKFGLVTLAQSDIIVDIVIFILRLAEQSLMACL
jgi:hypothetical protein